MGVSVGVGEDVGEGMGMVRVWLWVRVRVWVWIFRGCVLLTVHMPTHTSMQTGMVREPGYTKSHSLFSS